MFRGESSENKKNDDLLTKVNLIFNNDSNPKALYLAKCIINGDYESAEQIILYPSMYSEYIKGKLLDLI